VFAGTFLACVFGIAWVFGSAKWQAIDEQDAGKILAQEILRSVRERVPWSSRNGASGTTGTATRSKEKNE